MASRSRGRQLAVQVLYQYEYSGYTPDRVLELFWQNIKTDHGTRRFCQELVEGVLDCIDELNLEIGAYLKNWSLDRIVSLDKIVMQLAFYELLYAQDVPWRVVVDEAVVLAKMYSSEKSATFINGVLHAWATKNRLGTNKEKAASRMAQPDTSTAEATDTPGEGTPQEEIAASTPVTSVETSSVSEAVPQEEPVAPTETSSASEAVPQEESAVPTETSSASEVITPDET